MIINKKQVRLFIKANSKHVTQVDKRFYDVLNDKVCRMILQAISLNGSHTRLTSTELG